MLSAADRRVARYAAMSSSFTHSFGESSEVRATAPGGVQSPQLAAVACLTVVLITGDFEDRPTIRLANGLAKGWGELRAADPVLRCARQCDEEVACFRAVVGSAGVRWQRLCRCASYRRRF